MSSFKAFQSQTKHEFIQESAIAPSFYQSAIHVCSDIEVGPGGEVSTPIHDALGWQYTRFGNQVKPTTHAALFLNEDGSVWQAKLNRAAFKGSDRRYAAPTGNGSRCWLPHVDEQTRLKIAERYGVEVPLEGSFWDWLYYNPDMEIILTEGGKKAGALLSLGYVAIALYGVNSGYSVKDENGERVKPYLIPDLERFIGEGRSVTLTFDQDAKDKTRRRVTAALMRFGGLLRQAGSEVAIASWKQQDGKGIDDLSASCGPAAVNEAIAQAMPLENWAIWQRLEYQLTYTPSLQAPLDVIAADQLPRTGIVAIAAAKGTGKTKLIARMTGSDSNCLALSHRIALSRNLCERLGFDYRGDINGAKRAGVVRGGAYRIGVGACVDGLLAINPEDFKSCDLILDEVVQVVRHLLTSSTCAQDGKRPALLARFHSVIQSARRVIVADADLNNAVLHYLQQLRGEGQPCYLVKGVRSQQQGYPVRFLEAPDRSAITAEILSAVAELPKGQVLYVATDSKAGSKSLAHLLQQQHPQLRVLTINSETSGGQDEREFIQTPDPVLERGDYDVVICSPSVATGVSIEAQGIIYRVYGIFTGVSSTDADMSQSLIRAREPVQRVVWCNRTGSNFCKVSRSTNPLELRSHLMCLTTATASLTRSQLREDSLAALQNYDWQSDPHLHLWSLIEAERNRAMRNLRTALLVRLQHEGHIVTVEEHPSNKALKTLLKSSRDAVALLDAEAIANAQDLTYSEVIEMQNQENLSPEQQRALAKWYLKDFYCMEALTTEDALADKQGRRRAELRSLEAQLYPETAIARDINTIDKQLEQAANWGSYICPWDVSDIEVRRWLRERIGLNDFLDPEKEWTKLDLSLYAERARQLAPEIKVALKLTISDAISDVQVVHQLLSQLGVKVAFRWSRSAPGLEGQKVRVYRLDREKWGEAIAILQRRSQRRECLIEFGSPASLDPPLTAGDPSNWTDSENMTIYRNDERAAAAVTSYRGPEEGTRRSPKPA